jgi:hypothetical protein
MESQKSRQGSAEADRGRQARLFRHRQGEAEIGAVKGRHSGAGSQRQAGTGRQEQKNAGRQGQEMAGRQRQGLLEAGRAAKQTEASTGQAGRVWHIQWQAGRQAGREKGRGRQGQAGRSRQVQGQAVKKIDA